MLLVKSGEIGSRKNEDAEPKPTMPSCGWASLVAVSKESACSVGVPGSIPGEGKSPEKEMANHCSILAWKTPWTEEPGRLQSTGLQGVRRD